MEKINKPNNINEPLVSVVVATFRRELSLKKAVQSLVCQIYDNIEIIIVDDNANVKWNAKVENIIENFLHDGRIKYIQNNSNQGSAKSRNIGIYAAKGEYITFLDDDDIYLKEKIDTQLSKMLDSDADYSLTDLQLLNEDDTISEYRTREYLISAKPEELLKCHLMYHMTGTDTMMFKKNYLLKIGAFDAIDVGDEYYLMQKAIDEGGVFCYVPACEVKAYVHTGEGGLSSGQGKIDGENRLFEYKKRYFNKLDRQSRQYINMRHYAVLAFANLRIKKYKDFLKNGIYSFMSSPIDCIKMVMKRKVT